ncbi:2751_t:CDS:1 [Cetraspora pellucida]|uniref:GDP-fucose protein O-fucosyltransferase 2 n=1 Tax=Cetraspora pellucida TaxID=1433469 RepID=A0A9N8ZWF6_9GLOM|nr:2751_t:CDS:1 [Cetraspora pellucida]
MTFTITSLRPTLCIFTLFILFFFTLWSINRYFYTKLEEIEEITSEQSDININRKYCTADKCKFLFTYTVEEQESQSNRHFESLIQIAQQLGRTMVLTNVEKSRISSRNHFPFNFYYNVDELSKEFPQVKFILQCEFQKWAEERYNKSDTIHVVLENSKSNPNYTVQYDTPYIDELVKEYEMDRFNLKLDNSTIFKRISIGTNGRSPRKGGKNNDLKNFLSEELESNAEVMLITQKGIRGPIFERLTPIPYASHITNAASNLTNQLKPYIAIHWRMESAKLNLMPKCAESLVTYLRNLSLTTGITTIYLATDYPLAEYKNKTAQSETFSHIYEEHHTAMKILNSSLNINTWVSTHALDYLQLTLDPTKKELLLKELSGGGIQGIFDKLILIQADYFIGGPKNCCRYLSTYTLQVEEARMQLLKNNGTIKNKIDRWKLY